MEISLEISMYPLDKDYIKPIQTFIAYLNEFENIEIITNPMSTQVFGDFDAVMNAFKLAMKQSFLDEDKVMLVTKFFNRNLLS